METTISLFVFFNYIGPVHKVIKFISHLVLLFVLVLKRRVIRQSLGKVVIQDSAFIYLLVTKEILLNPPINSVTKIYSSRTMQ